MKNPDITPDNSAEDTSELPPFFRTWQQVYTFVTAFWLFCLLALWLFSRL